MFLKNNGDVLGWGQPLIAEGRGNVPPYVKNAVAIANVFDYARAVLADGSVELWGDFCAEDYRNSALGIHSATGFVDSCSYLPFSVVLLQDGGISVIGANNASQTSIPSNVTNIVQVAAGEIGRASCRERV